MNRLIRFLIALPHFLFLPLDRLNAMMGEALEEASSERFYRTHPQEPVVPGSIQDIANRDAMRLAASPGFKRAFPAAGSVEQALRKNTDMMEAINSGEIFEEGSPWKSMLTPYKPEDFSPDVPLPTKVDDSYQASIVEARARALTQRADNASEYERNRAMEQYRNDMDPMTE